MHSFLIANNATLKEIHFTQKRLPVFATLKQLALPDFQFSESTEANNT